MKKPLVSIVIPVYNVEKYLKECLDSVIAQTYNNLEIICVNDGSPDQSIKILRAYANQDKRIKVVEIENQGLSGARNVGTSICTGEYLMYLDSDDWVDKTTIESSVRIMLETKVDLVLWNYVKEYTNASKAVDVFTKSRVFKGDAFVQLHQQLIGLVGKQLRNPAHCDSISTAWGKLYKTNIIKDNNISFVDTKIIGTEDLLFNAEYFNFCQSAAALSARFNHYRKQNSDSLARQYKPHLYEQWKELHRRLGSVCADRDYLAKSVSNRSALSIIGLGINLILAPISFNQKYIKLKKILKEPRFIRSLRNIEIANMPIHWKVLFGSARFQLTFFVLILFYVITGITHRH